MFYREVLAGHVAAACLPAGKAVPVKGDCF